MSDSHFHERLLPHNREIERALGNQADAGSAPLPVRDFRPVYRPILS
jgi:hypothetical protein